MSREILIFDELKPVLMILFCAGGKAGQLDFDGFKPSKILLNCIIGIRLFNIRLCALMLRLRLRLTGSISCLPHVAVLCQNFLDSLPQNLRESFGALIFCWSFPMLRVRVVGLGI